MDARYGLVLLAMLVACETPLDIAISSDYESVLVVNSFFTPDSVWTLRVSRSVPIEEPASALELFVADAIVTLSEASGTRETLQHRAEGTFHSVLGSHPLVGETYELAITSPGFESVRAVSVAPELESEFTGIAPAGADLDEGVFYRIRFNVTDRPGKSYYRLSLYQVAPSCRTRSGHVSVHDAPTAVLDYTKLTFESAAPSFYHDAAVLDEPPNALDEEGVPFFAAYFSDRLFENAARDFEIVFEREGFQAATDSLFMLVVSALSEDQIRHDRTLLLQDDYLFAADPVFTKPIDVYSNVEGGLGIFAGYTSDTFRFDLDGRKWKESGIGIGEHPLPPCDY